MHVSKKSIIKSITIIKEKGRRIRKSNKGVENDQNKLSLCM
jgi:hypothetical protein